MIAVVWREVNPIETVEEEVEKESDCEWCVPCYNADQVWERGRELGLPNFLTLNLRGPLLPVGMGVH